MRKSGIDFTAILAGTAGAVAGGCGAAMLKKLPLDAKWTNGIALVAGAVLPILAPNNSFIASLGAGMSAVGGQKLLADVTGSDLIAGVDFPSVANDNAISGNIIPSVANNSALSGRASFSPETVGME